jgi:hypothetical protein
VEIFKSPTYTATTTPVFTPESIAGTVLYNNSASGTVIDGVTVSPYAYYFSVPKLTQPTTGTNYVYYGMKNTASSADIYEVFSNTLDSTGILGGTTF